MESNNSWSIVSLPLGKTSIVCKWVLKNKYNVDDSLSYHIARSVAKGYRQKEGIDFLEIFPHVAKLAMIKMLLVLAASPNWILTQLGINNTFLNDDLFDEVYMDLPL